MDNIMDDAINNTNDYRSIPIMSLKNEYRKTYANYIQFNGFAEYEFIKGLKLKVSRRLHVRYPQRGNIQQLEDTVMVIRNHPIR